ncbi:MAG: hypothetical protein RIS29_2466 [Bacteroidota bacterium]|jgi:hypothetical protein
MIAYEQYIKTNKAAFISDLQKYCNLLGILVDDLMTVMYAESRLNERARNPYTRATGLLQFMPSTAVGLGTTVDALYNMNNVQQLYYVYLYFKPYIGKIHNVYDLYKVVFFPASLGKPQTWTFETSKLSASLVATQNPAIDLNKDKKITVAEFEQYVSNYIKKKSMQS